jgi:hypothetical protein
MRHLYDHDTTMQLLRTWAGSSPLITGCFFFYYLGNDEQKTYEGLTRTLLYHVLQSDRTLIKKVLPDMWKELRHALNPQHKLDLPTRAETKAAFQRLCEQPVNICLFIDGLDEYSGRCEDGISLLRLLSEAPRIKVLVSSRPEPAFAAAFGGDAKLRMQDLNKEDIEKYVEDTIGSHPHMQALTTMESLGTRARRLVVDLVEKADGIFLWIVLACRSLLDGFARGDSLPNLERRVAELPEEIRDMFAYMLRKVPSKKERVSGIKYLQICAEANRKPLEITPAFTTRFTLDVPAIGFATLDETNPNLVGCSILKAVSAASDRNHMYDMFVKRLNSQAGGLLETRVRDPSNPPDSSEVVFIHRTVVEFLADQGVWETGVLDVGEEDFHPAASLSCLWMHMAQLSQEINVVTAAMARSLCYLQVAARAAPKASIRPLLDFQKVLCNMDPTSIDCCVVLSVTAGPPPTISSP